MFESKQLKSVIKDIETTKAIIDIESNYGSAYKNKLLIEQNVNILKKHNIKEEKIKKILSHLIDSGDIQSLF